MASYESIRTAGTSVVCLSPVRGPECRVLRIADLLLIVGRFKPGFLTLHTLQRFGRTCSHRWNSECR